MGYVIIPKSHSSSREWINCHCGRFDWTRISTGVICQVAVVGGPTALNHDRRPTNTAVAGPFNRNLLENGSSW